MKDYGKTDNDIDADKSERCRQIVREIINFGIDENQKLKIIKLISLELENNSNMKKIVNVIKEIDENKSSDKLLTL
jgi:hypothetical protein